MIHSHRWNHGDLLASAGAIQEAARRGDLDAMHTALCLQQTDLTVHIHAERSGRPRLTPAVRPVVVDGREHLGPTGAAER